MDVSYSTLFYMQGLFFGFPHGFDSLADYQRSFGGGDIEFSTRSFVPYFDLLITSSLVIRTW